MQLPVLTFSGLLEQMAAGLQGAATQFIDLTIGSVLRAILEACASVALWLQWLVLQVLATTRAATSNGPDLDSWMADFSFVRLAGADATGSVQFARYTPGIAAVVPVGCQVLTSDGTQGFSVVADPSNPAWNGAGGYTVPAPLASITVPAQANVVGLAGNVLVGAIGVLASPINGIDTVINSAAFAGGAGAESDANLRSRFLLYINSRSQATVAAIMNAVASVGPGLRMAVIENVDTQFHPVPGSFVVVADDGSGMPSAILLTNVQAAVDLVRPIGSIFAVQRPATLSASITVTLETSNPLTHLAVAAGVQQAITTWIDGLPIAGILAISKIDAIAHGFDSSVVSVTSTLINEAADDVVAPINGVILATSVMVS